MSYAHGGGGLKGGMVSDPGDSDDLVSVASVGQPIHLFLEHQPAARPLGTFLLQPKLGPQPPIITGHRLILCRPGYYLG